MEDREMLELAAKAAGHEWRWYGAPLGPLFQIKTHNGIWIFWNPLNGDGEALRLAVKLRLHIEWRADGRSAVSPDDGYSGIYELASSRENALENLRRAIVRAAAEIGKQMA